MRSNKIFTLVTIIAVLIMTAGSIFFIYKWNLKKIGEKTTETAVDEQTAAQEADKQTAYYNEVNYIGGIGYPEVYDTPFKISDYYISNKELWKRSPDAIPIISDTATDFINAIMNIGYRNIIENRESIKKNLVSYLDPYWIYGTEDEPDYTAEEYIDRFLDEAIDKKIVTDGRFVTDTSLVYYDWLYIVRGMLEYNVYQDGDSQADEASEPQKVMMEVLLTPKNDGTDGYEIVHWFIKNNENTSAEED